MGDKITAKETMIKSKVPVVPGSDGLLKDHTAIARHLENSGFDVRVLLSTPATSFTGDAATNFSILRRAGTPIVDAPADISTAWRDELAQADWIVDALLGTGAQGNVREPFTSAIAAINAANRQVLAVDLPSGLDSDTGAVLGSCVRAHHTATFVARKPGFDVSGTAEFTGEVHVLDIGVPRSLLRELSESSAASSAPSE